MFQHVGQFDGIVLGDRHVDLHRHAELFQILEAVDGRVEGSGNSAEGVVGLGIGAVQGDGDALDAGVDNLLRHFLGDQGAVGGQGDAQTFVGGILRELEDIRAIERFAAGKHQDGIRECGNLIDDVQRLASWAGRRGRQARWPWHGNARNEDYSLW